MNKRDIFETLYLIDFLWFGFLQLLFAEAEHLHLNKKEKSLIGCFDDFKQSLNDCFRSQAINSEQPFSIIKQYNIHKFNSLQK